jgi:hypothetical protein
MSDRAGDDEAVGVVAELIEEAGATVVGIVEGSGVDPQPPSRPANGRDLPGVVGRGDKQEGLDGRGEATAPVQEDALHPGDHWPAT